MGAGVKAVLKKLLGAPKPKNQRKAPAVLRHFDTPLLRAVLPRVTAAGVLEEANGELNSKPIGLALLTPVRPVL